MKIKLSRIFLISSVSLMLVVGIVFGSTYNVKHELIGISGNSKEMDDIAFITQYKYDLYNSKEIIVTNENVQEKSFAKEVSSEFPPTKYIKDNREIIGFSNRQNQIYEDKNKIGTLGVYWEYKENLDRNILQLNISEKNLKNNKVENYEIPLESYNDGEHSYSRSIAHTYKGQLYAIILTGVHEEVEVDDGYGTKFKELLLSVHKVDLDNQKAENILSKSLGKHKYYEGESDSFKFDEKIYTLISESESESEYENEEYGETKLLYYNIEDNNLEIIEIPNLGSQLEYDNISTIFLNGDKAYLQGEFFIDKNNIMNITLGEIDLNSNDNKIKVVKKAIKVSDFGIGDKDVSSPSYNIDDIKIINNKLYMSWSLYLDIPGSHNDERQSYSNLLVVDNLNNKVLYQGMMEHGKFYIPSMKIVNKEEI